MDFKRRKVMAYQRDPITDAINNKKRYARKCFNEKYKTGKEKEDNIPVLTETLYQIQACEELCKPASESKIKDWINSGNIAYIARTARSIKFA
jgi:hypothetical protein